MQQESGPPMDVWDVGTFDAELLRLLEENTDLIRSYWAERRRLFVEREAQTMRGPPTHNCHGPAYSALRERVTAIMQRRTVRAWHFTRLLPHEIDGIRAGGMQPMTLGMIAERLDRAVASGALDRLTADELYRASPYHDQVDGNRELRIWLSSQPFDAEDSGVTGLLQPWGGESISFNHLEGGRLHGVLRGVGRACVVEVALPLMITTRAGCAAENVLDAYSFTLGCSGGWGGGCDLVAVEPIEPGWILAIHVEGDAVFASIGGGYPSNFVRSAD